MSRTRRFFEILVAVSLLAGSTQAAGGKGSFLESNEYKKGGASVGHLLTDDQYGKMIGETTWRGHQLDWAWVPGVGDSRKLESLGFQAGEHTSIIVQKPVDHTDRNIDWLSDRAQEVIMIGCKRLGWDPSPQGNLKLETAIVDLLVSDGFDAVKFLNASNDHFVEFEFRLTEAVSGKELLLARHRTHSANLVGAVWRGIEQLTAFLDNPVAPYYTGSGKSASLDLFDMPGEKKRHKLEKYSDPRAIVVGSMASSGLFTSVPEDPATADYGLEVRVLEANIVGAYQTTINVLTDYTLKNHHTRETILQEEVATSATMTAAEIRSGGKRLKSVVPSAFQNNIDTFLFRLAMSSALQSERGSK